LKPHWFKVSVVPCAPIPKIKPSAHAGRGNAQVMDKTTNSKHQTLKIKQEASISKRQTANLKKI
jgi:hypothetical protein